MSLTKSIPWVAGAILALEPALWLVDTWRAEGGASAGPWVGALSACLFLWSVTSPGGGIKEGARRRAATLLTLSALTRLGAQILAINVLGALTLVLDVFALGSYFGLGARRRRVSPHWLAILFALSLPVERILQRVLGYGLQQISAAGACGVLGAAFDDVQCGGVRILLNGQDVQVGLPCSGARGLVTTAILFAVLAALKDPRWLQSLLGAALWALCSVLGNVCRVSALAIGLAYPEAIAGIDVMAQPWHDALGLITLGLGSIPLVMWAQGQPVFPVVNTGEIPPVAGSSSGRRGRSGFYLPLVPVVALVLFAPGRPLDVSAPQAAISLPEHLAGNSLSPVALSEMEERYFTQYGGAAAKGSYGPFGLLVVKTTSPLRHLHTPSDCLAGAGHTVSFLGIQHGERPAAIYHSIAPDGSQWRVALTYFDDQGRLATSVSEVAYRWLEERGQTWTAVQRISPWEATDAHVRGFEAAAAAALDMPIQVDFTKSQLIYPSQS